MSEEQIEEREPSIFIVLDENDVVINKVLDFEENKEINWLPEPTNTNRQNTVYVGCKYIRSKNYFLHPNQSEEEINQAIQTAVSHLVELKTKYDEIVASYTFQNALDPEIRDKVLEWYNRVNYILENHEEYPYEIYQLISGIISEPYLPKLNIENEV